MSRVIILLMDSFGIGASIDAGNYGDGGSNTFAHIHDACGPLSLPNLSQRGLYHATLASCGRQLIEINSLPEPCAYFGYAVEKSFGKDTPSGHWELAGVPILFDWGYFENKKKCFPQPLIDGFISQASLPGVLGECHASGTVIIEQLGQEHIKTGKPIVYTSADSVFQIAAHEEYFGLKKLYRCCEIARKLVDPYNIGRVIARPFIGEAGDFQRSANRRDYATPPPEPTLLDYLKQAGRQVISIGKIADIFAHLGITQTIKADGNMALFDATLDAVKQADDGALVFTNFVDFDSKYGHRRNVKGYADALEAFDARLPELDEILKSDDMVVISADHGCDPTFKGSNHTREHVPVLAYHNNCGAKFIGRRDSFADIGQSIAQFLEIAPLNNGVSFL
jgi:phosphopentomutase